MMNAAITGLQSPAVVQPFNAGDETLPVLIAVAVTEPGQRQKDADDASALNPPRNARNDNGDASQNMADAAAQ